MNVNLSGTSTRTLTDAPIRLRTHNLKFRNGGLGEQRTEISSIRERTHLVETSSFFFSALPPAPSEVCIEYIINDLKRDGPLEQGGEMWRWTKLTDWKPQKYAFLEILSDVFNKIVYSIEERYKLESTQSFVMSTRKSLHLDTNSEEDFISDLCLARLAPGSVTEDGIDGGRLGQCNYSLSIDACRRFVYGLTLEKDTIYLAYISVCPNQMYLRLQFCERCPHLRSA